MEGKIIILKVCTCKCNKGKNEVRVSFTIPHYKFHPFLDEKENLVKFKIEHCMIIPHTHKWVLYLWKKEYPIPPM
jgi:hypothetical protein